MIPRAIYAQGQMATEDSLLVAGELEIIGRLVDASNASLLCKLSDDTKVIYKPIAGERPLWDFPDGNLASREVAAYYISNIGNFNVIPRTLLRQGPFGIGAVQEWIEILPDVDVVELAQSDDSQIRNIALLDIVINNADRKFGHLLISENNKIFGCDHGVCFHEENKLRTVIWQFADLEFEPHEIEKLRELSLKIDKDYLATLLTSNEIAALFQRIMNLIEIGKFATPNPNWPAVPWPPY